jgi:hypothetical protein
MCEDFDGGDYEPVHRQTWRWQRSRAERECCACEATIRVGALYHYSAWLSDGSWTQIRHCARCWAIVEHLWSVTDRAIDIRLGCGETYDAPPDDPGHALAFMSDAEAEAWALTRPKVDDNPGGSWVVS